MTGSFRRDWDDAHQPLQQALKTALGGHLRGLGGRRTRRDTLVSNSVYLQAATELCCCLCLFVREVQGGLGQSSKQRQACMNYVC
jgi:hypothetical protein